MIHHVIYYELREPADSTILDEMIRASRTWLLKIPEVLAVHSGRNLDPQCPWQFFYAIEVESREKLRFVKDDAFYLKFLHQHIEPHAGKSMEMNFELDPSRDIKYS